MQLLPEIVAVHEELVSWRRYLHAHPELAFEESHTADFVARQLASFGIEVTRGVGKTGVVGTLQVGGAEKAVGLRADMDALSMQELNTFAHKSKHTGRMHGCGHDGHTVMLLAAARYLAKSNSFSGTVQFIFQPAEEANGAGSGAKAMINDGLFERFAIDSIFAMHNAPDVVTGAIMTCSGPVMASMDLFEVTIIGEGAHGAFPHRGIDPVYIATQLISAWQSIVSRNTDALESVVISATSISTGDSWNVIPETAVIRGSIRTLSQVVRQLVHDRFLRLTNGIVEGFGAKADIDYSYVYPVTINDAEQTSLACDVAASIVGENHVLRANSPAMGSEDFAYMLQERPGCYMAIGSALIPEDRASLNDKNIKLAEDEAHFVVEGVSLLHEPTYDFNDRIIPLGATLFVRLAEKVLR